MEVFPYSWNTYEENGCLGIRVFGLNKNNENVFILINDFKPYVYLELPPLPAGMSWEESIFKLNSVSAVIDRVMGKSKPVKKVFEMKKKLYYAKKDFINKEYVDKVYPFLKCYFNSFTDLKNCSYRFKKPVRLSDMGDVMIKVHESDANPILQFMCMKNIKPASWFKFVGKKITNEYEKITTCEHEYETSYKNFISIDNNNVAKPYIMSFDIEVNSSNPNIAPQFGVPEDKIFQISCVFCRNGDSEKSYDKYILSLGKNKKGELIDLVSEKVGEDIEIRMYDTEADLLIGFNEIIHEKNPNIICGYNIFGFDIPYIYERAKLNYVDQEFSQLSFVKDLKSEKKEIKWDSSAFKNQHFIYLDAPGRLWIDMLPVIQRDYKLENYKLKTVSDTFLGQTKDPLTHKGIFKCYRMFTPDSLSIVAKYCVKDSELVVKLFEKLQIWIGLVEMSNTCNTPIFALFTQGQQIKIFSQVYKKCMGDNYVIDKDSFIVNENDNFTGAYVFTPKPGLYDMVVSFDFSSLYPSTIIAYNIDYTTLVLDEKIPDDMCHIFDWWDHCGCEHDTSIRNTKPKNIVCGHQRFRFLKEPPGVIPTLLKNLLDARKRTRKEMEKLQQSLDELKGEEKEATQRTITVLDKRQLAFKISANSVSSVTPIPCMDEDGNFMYLTMEEISNGDWISDDEKNQVSKPKKGLLTWTEKGWTLIKFVIRHPIRTPLKRVLTHTGCVDVTDEHSLLDDKANEVRTIDLKVGDSLLHYQLPLPKDTPSEPIYRSISNEDIINFDLKDNKKYKEAFLHGLFFAEGTCGSYGVLEKAKSSWIIYNQDEELLSKTLKIAEDVENMNFIVTKYYEKARQLIPNKNPKGSIVKIIKKYRNMFYDARGFKRIPQYIFNSDFYTRQSFFMGYYYGDGNRHLDVGVAIQNKGEIGSAGLCYLAKSLGYKVSLSYQKENIFRLQCCTDFRNKKIDVVKKIDKSPIVPEIKVLKNHIIDNTEYIYDIETENHHFAAGVGDLIVHNSMYGGMGVKKGYLPFLPGAMCTTARGRESIEKASKFLIENFGAKLIYGDSVTGDTPILVRYEDKTVDILRIDEIGEVWKPYEEFKMEDSNRKEKQQTLPFVSSGNYRIMNILEVWTGNEWSRVRRIIRHKTVKKIYRVLTHTGCVDVTEDHSLLDPQLNKIKPTDLVIGSELYHSFPPVNDFLEVEFKDALIEGKVYECIKCKEHKLFFEFYENYKNICKECDYKDHKKDKTYNNQYVSETEYIRNLSRNLDENLAYVWGLFFAEGSCGEYRYKNTNKSSWAINNQDIELLKRCKTILEKAEPLFGWKILDILDTMKSSSVYKLVPLGNMRFIVNKWRKLFYDKEGYKKVPYFVLNSNDEIKKSFFNGYYEGDGDKDTYNKISQYKFDIKGKIGAHGLFTLLYSLGLNVEINTKNKKENIYTLHTCKKYRNIENEVKKIVDLGETKDDYVYDIETESGRFSGGIGKMVLKNTDSCYISFPQYQTAKDARELDLFCRQIEVETSNIFPKPMKFAYEEAIYWRYLILTKKRYMALKCDLDGNIKDKIEKRGVLLSRRDNSAFSRDFYSKIIMKTFYKESFENISYVIRDELDKLYSNSISPKDLSISKSVGDIKDYKIKALPTPEECVFCKYKTVAKDIKDIKDIIYCDKCRVEHHDKTKCINCNKNLPYLVKISKSRNLKNKDIIYPLYCYNCKEDDMIDIVNKKLQKRLEDLKLFDRDANLEVVLKIFNDFIKNTDDFEEYSYKNSLEYQIVMAYISKCLPSQVQLAEKMRKRGTFVAAGERISYLVIESENIKDKLFDKIEDLDYFKENSSYIKIDHLYYTKLMINPVNEILQAVYSKNKIMDKIYKYKQNYYKVICQLKELFSPSIHLL